MTSTTKQSTPRPLRYRHLIWDFNGTILDDAALCTDICNAMLTKRRLPTITLDDYRRIFDLPVKDYYEKLGIDFTRESFTDLAHEFNATYATRRFECALHPHVIDILDRWPKTETHDSSMNSDTIGHSVLSAYQTDALRQCLEHFGIAGRFTIVAGLDHFLADSKVARAKRLIDELAIDPRDVLMIGDMTHDIDAARAMGTDIVLFSQGHQSFAHRPQAAHVKTIASHTELIALVES